MATPTLNKVIDHEDISIVVADATGTPVTLALTLENASLSLTGLQAGGIAQAVVPGVRRGKLRSLHRGERTFPQVSLTGVFTGVDKDELHNFLLKRETYVANATTAGTGQKVYVIDMQVTVLETNWGGIDKVIVIKQCHFTVDFAEQDNAEVQVSFSGTCYGEVLVTGSDAIQTERV